MRDATGKQLEVGQTVEFSTWTEVKGKAPKRGTATGTVTALSGQNAENDKAGTVTIKGSPMPSTVSTNPPEAAQ